MTLGDHYIEGMEEEIIKIRRHLHACPEPSGSEFKTTEFLVQQVVKMGLKPEVAPTNRGLVVNSPGPIRSGQNLIGMRADIDALRLQDEKTVIYRSTESNLMHACGHDAHTAMLLGAIGALNHLKKYTHLEFAWRAIFQPAEETAAGALEMIQFGAAENLDSLIALHVDPMLPIGQVGWRKGALTAFCEEFTITITGRGGHGARPHHTVDPIAAACQYINAVYQNIPRVIDVRDPAVVSFGVFQGGINPNVVPESVSLRGTLRTVNPNTSRAVKDRMRAIAEGICQAAGVTFRMDIPYFIESVDNHPDVTEQCRLAASDVLGHKQVVWIEHPSMGGEDFAHYLSRVRGCMLRLGVANPDEQPRYLHSPKFDINEKALVYGAKIFTRAALRLSFSRQTHA